MSDGYTDRQIAAALGRNVNTFYKDVRNILAKLNAHSRTEACVRAIREGLITN
jgi:DNA-binding CsgD family transcriptional regulator